jgi:hypothetical protein
MVYQIQIKGKLDESWADWLGEVSISSALDPQGGWNTTIIVDAEDSPALFGILDRIRDLNLSLISLTVLGP